MIRSNVMITADLPLAVLLFLAFFLWWTGYRQGALGFGRWLAIGVVLAFAGLLKGPQPLAYFALGIGCYVLLSRSWRQIPGLAMAGLICALPLAFWYAAIYTPGDQLMWAAFMRVHPAALLPGPLHTSFAIVTEMLPAVLMAAAFLIAETFGSERAAPAGFVAAAACYAFIAAVIILFWPGGSAPRYYLPMTMMLCVFGGLGYDLLNTRRPEIVAPMLLMTAGLLTYALVPCCCRRSCRGITGNRKSMRHGSLRRYNRRRRRSIDRPTRRSTSCPTCQSGFSTPNLRNCRQYPVRPG